MHRCKLRTILQVGGGTLGDKCNENFGQRNRTRKRRAGPGIGVCHTLSTSLLCLALSTKGRKTSTWGLHGREVLPFGGPSAERGSSYCWDGSPALLKWRCYLKNMRVSFKKKKNLCMSCLPPKGPHFTCVLSKQLLGPGF